MIDVVDNILQNDAGIIASIGANHVFVEEPDQGTNKAFVIISMNEGNPNNTKDAPSSVDEGRVSVFSYGNRFFTNGGDVGSFSLNEIVRTALDHFTGVVLGNEVFVMCDNPGSSFKDEVINKTSTAYESEYLIHQNR